MADDLIIPTSGPPKAPDPAPGHPAIFAQDCSVCTHEHRPAIEALYLACRPLSFIAGLANLDLADLEKHVIALGLDKQRGDATEEMTRYALNKSFDRDVLANLDADQTIRLMQWSEKRLGKVKERENEARPQVVIVGVPMVGRPVARADGDQAAEQAKVVKAKNVEVLPLPMFTVKP